MNRIGMMVDISHVNNYTMMDVLDTSLAPGQFNFNNQNLAFIVALKACYVSCIAVIFSHSSAYALCNNPRNVPDNVLRRLVCYIVVCKIQQD